MEAVDVKQSLARFSHKIEIPEKGTQGHPCFAKTTGVRLASHTNNQETDGLSTPRLPWTCLFNGCNMIRLITHSGGIIMVTDDLVTIWRQWLLLLTPGTYKYSLLIHRIKIKSPAKFYGMNKTCFWEDFFLFTQLLFWWYYTDEKAYRILAILPIKMSALPSLPWSLASTPWAYTSNFVQYIFDFLVNVNDEISRQCITLYDS